MSKTDRPLILFRARAGSENFTSSVTTADLPVYFINGMAGGGLRTLVTVLDWEVKGM